MKKILGLLLACMLILSMTAALAEPIDKIVFNLQGYAVGLNAEDTRIKWNGEGVKRFEYVTGEVTEPEIGKGYFGLLDVTWVGNSGNPIAKGPLKADVPYMLEILIPLGEMDEEDTSDAIPPELFDLVNAYAMKFGGIIPADFNDDGFGEMAVAMFVFQLEPAPKTLPATGDGAELMMWSAMVAFAAVSLVALNKKRVFGR